MRTRKSKLEIIFESYENHSRFDFKGKFEFNMKTTKSIIIKQSNRLGCCWDCKKNRVWKRHNPKVSQIRWTHRPKLTIVQDQKNLGRWLSIWFDPSKKKLSIGLGSIIRPLNLTSNNSQIFWNYLLNMLEVVFKSGKKDLLSTREKKDNSSGMQCKDSCHNETIIT
jgi:hypothetical protein